MPFALGQTHGLCILTYSTLAHVLAAVCSGVFTPARHWHSVTDPSVTASRHGTSWCRAGLRVTHFFMYICQCQMVLRTACCDISHTSTNAIAMYRVVCVQV